MIGTPTLAIAREQRHRALDERRRGLGRQRKRRDRGVQVATVEVDRDDRGPAGELLEGLSGVSRSSGES